MEQSTSGILRHVNSPLETLVREVTKIPLGLKFALCVSTNIIHFSIAGPLARL